MLFYRELILEHYKNPRNQGELKDPDCRAHGDNPLCGDELDLDIRLKSGKIDDVAFKATGCAISVAAMSILSEKIEGMTSAQVRELRDIDIKEMLGVELSASRVKCALLGLWTVRKCLHSV